MGKIVALLDELKLAENTIVIFASDNGGEATVTVNGALRGGKSMLYEGGIRVPLIVRWPGHVPAGKRCDVPVAVMDFYPTLLDLAGVRPDSSQTVDGVSLRPLLIDGKEKLTRDALYWHYPLDKPHFLGGRSSGAVRQSISIVILRPRQQDDGPGIPVGFFRGRRRVAHEAGYLR